MIPTVRTMLRLLLWSCVALVARTATADLQPDVATFERRVRPLLAKYCVRCHSGDEPAAGIVLDGIDPDLIRGVDFGHWEDIREAFNTGDMPPADEPQPTTAERQAMARWLDAEFRKALRHASTVPRGRVRRLTRYEMQYALEDLLHTSVQRHIRALPEEGTSVETGLKNNGQLLMISSPHLESYLNVILAIIDEMKQITTYEPCRISADIAQLDVDPPVTYADKGRPNKPPVARVERAGPGVTVGGGGYIDLQIPAISKYAFDTTLSVRAADAGTVRVAIGYQRSDVDPRQNLQTLGTIPLVAGDELQSYSLRAWPDQLPAEMTRAIDRPFFIRVTNAGRKPFYLESFDYLGNNNTALTATLISPDAAAEQLPDHARRKIDAFLRRAFRRAPSPAETDRYTAIYTDHARDERPAEALLSAYQAILCSPAFFYLGMPGAGDGAREAATAAAPADNDAVAVNFRLAERLAFYLWCSVPDERLLDRAASAQLTEPAVLSAEVQRLLADDRSLRFVEHFTDQWLQTSLLFNVAVDRTYYPRYRETLKPFMRQETVAAVNDVVRQGASALDLLKADHVFVNQPLATFYGLRGVRGDEFRRVKVPADRHRGGLLTQATFLIGNSDGMNSHAILRGVWLAALILDDPPPDPPANVPPLDESIPGFETMTLNQKLFAHRDNAACRSCHQQIDPWGLPFENYDASGAWREQVLVVSKTTKRVQQGQKKRRKTVFEKSYVPIDRQATTARWPGH